MYSFKNFIFLFIFFLFCCNTNEINDSCVNLIVLGVAQDGGYPQANCEKKCCKQTWYNIDDHRMVACLGFWDESNNQKWIIELTPDFKHQLKLLNFVSGNYDPLDGAFISHAHVGHYTGLINFGKEIMFTSSIDINVMPRMKLFLENNAPWDQIVENKNILLKEMSADSIIVLNENISIKPILVPHRDEYSETVGFVIYGPFKKVLFIPDIDKWSKWDQDICELIQNVDLAFLDGTFFNNGELPNRDMADIPHPFITESIELFSKLSHVDRGKIYFIHFNHTNPVLSNSFDESLILDFNISRQNEIFKL
tara:strand:+ start:2956 stop:3882 length:927 start_codon:yes stop_codon:yes gene_type:complete